MDEKIIIKPEDLNERQTQSNQQTIIQPIIQQPVIQQPSNIQVQRQPYTHPSLSALPSWAGFIAIITIIGGILSMFTIIGIIPGIVAIFLGSKLISFKNEFRLYLSTNDNYALNKSLSSLNSYFAIQGWLIILAIILPVIVITILILLGINVLQYIYELLSNLSWF